MRKIDDHAFWAGNKSKGSVFPEGAKTKQLDSAKGAGDLMRYEDTEEDVRRMQNMAVSKANSHEQKAGYRN